MEERFGTLINISLGEGFIGLVEAMRDQPWTGSLLESAGLSLLIGFSLWWGFFESLDLRPITEVRRHNRTLPYKVWLLAQLPLAASVAATGIAVGNVVRNADAPALDGSQRWLICGTVAICYLAHAIMHVAYASAGVDWNAGRVAIRKMLTIAGALAIGAFGHVLSPVGVLTLLAIAASAQVAWNIWDRAHAHARSGGDPGPGLSRAQREA
jgi:low temperature requirement protein LtrA